MKNKEGKSKFTTKAVNLVYKKLLFPILIKNQIRWIKHCIRVFNKKLRVISKVSRKENFI